jgi:hypothetical protein
LSVAYNWFAFVFVCVSIFKIIKKSNGNLSQILSIFLLYIQLILFLFMFPAHAAIFLCSAQEQSQAVGLLSNRLAQLILSLFLTADG